MSKRIATIRVPRLAPRSAAAQAATHRPAVRFRHRNQPRGGAQNVQASYFDEIADENEADWFDEDRDG